MGRIIANTSGKVFVVRVVSVLFNPLLIKIVGIAITPRRNAFTTLVAIKGFAHGHDTPSKNKNLDTQEAPKIPLPQKITRLASPKKVSILAFAEIIPNKKRIYSYLIMTPDETD